MQTNHGHVRATVGTQPKGKQIRRLFLVLSRLVVLIAPLLSPAQEETIISFGSTWLWRKGTNEISSPASAWRQRLFDDSSWPAGKAPFYYGYSAKNGTLLADMQSMYTTVYLRRSFLLADVADIVGLELHEFVDDGFVVWINGVEVQRFNVSAGDLPYNAGTPSAINKMETNAVVTVTPGLLVQGTNTVAVHAINRNLSSSDFYFDLELRVRRRVTAAPAIRTVVPEPGTIQTSLTEIRVVFNKPVVGIEAHEFYVNGLPATFVSGSSGTNVYVFYFSQPPPGPVDVRFGTDHNITDLEGARFDETSAGASWRYTLADTTGPRVSRILPV
ncbi:MAG: hypothetical protein N3G20_11135, partial [Verrucomicrobiae bacterium]|nr:hypothetical protein [Verrucomicrobiae bacterium]